MKSLWWMPVIISLSLAAACGSSGQETNSDSHPSEETAARPGSRSSPAGGSETSGSGHDLVASTVCGVDEDCDDGERCVADHCRPFCAVDADCGSAPCDLDSGTCASAHCGSNDDCGPLELCSGGWCYPAVPRGDCTQHTTRCRGTDLAVCNLEGTGEVLVPCDRPCVEDDGGAHCGEEECHPFAVGCVDGDEVFECDELGTTLSVTECDDGEYCEEGACRPRICEPESIWCAGDDLVTCDADGGDYLAVSCATTAACAAGPDLCVCRDGACLELACLPGTGRCTADGLQRCNDDGSDYLEVETCGPAHACREGGCHEVVCEPGERSCRGDLLAECDESGTQIVETDCLSSDAFCDGEGTAAKCQPQLCVPGTSTCNAGGTAVLRCDARGADTVEMACPQWGCSAGACLPEPTPDGWVRIEPGYFVMGSPMPEPGREVYEMPHEVQITRPFFLQETEVTQAQWRDVIGNSPSYFTECGDDCPVESVSFWDILAFTNRLSEQEGLQPCYIVTDCEGRPGGGCGGSHLCEGDYTCASAVFEGLGCTGYRLPTEAEWEYAIRAGTLSALYNGDITYLGSDPLDLRLDAIAWYAGNSDGMVHPVGLREPNAWGLHDMSGNVYEFVWDWFGVGYETYERTDPLGPPWGENRVARGGSWFSDAVRNRSAYRHNHRPNMRLNSYGFRLARSSLSDPALDAE